MAGIGWQIGASWFSLRRLLGVLAIFAVVALTASIRLSTAKPAAAASRPETTAVAGNCSRATASQLVKAQELTLNPFSLPNPIEQLLCGPFTGPGSRAMAVAIGVNPTCWPVQRWVVFNFTGGSWKLVLNRPDFIYPPLVAVGSDIRVETPVFRPGDPRCIPSGGSKLRIWHWNGSSFVAGAPTQGKAPAAVTGAIFNSPRGLATQCSVTDKPGTFVGVYCQSVQIKPTLYQQTAKLAANGAVRICQDKTHSNRCNLGNAGEEKIRTLNVGQQITVGRFTCRVLGTGVECVLTATGKGFLINATSAHPVP